MNTDREKVADLIETIEGIHENITLQTGGDDVLNLMLDLLRTRFPDSSREVDRRLEERVAIKAKLTQCWKKIGARKFYTGDLLTVDEKGEVFPLFDKPTAALVIPIAEGETLDQAMGSIVEITHDGKAINGTRHENEPTTEERGSWNRFIPPFTAHVLNPETEGKE